MPNNPAARMREYVKRAISVNGGTTIDAWAEAFGLNSDPDKKEKVLRRLLLVADEVRAIELFGEANLRPEHWKTQLHVVGLSLSFLNVSSGWKDHRDQLNAANTMLALEWLADMMPDEGLLDTQSEETKTLRADLITFRARIVTSVLPPATREVLYRALEDMIRAIEEAPIGGARAAWAHAFELHATLATGRAELEVGAETEELTMFQGLTKRFNTWVPRLETLGRIASALSPLIDLGNKLRQLGSGDATPPA